MRLIEVEAMDTLVYSKGCAICGKEEYPIDTKKFPKEFCSWHCYEQWLKWEKQPNCECAYCHRPMYMKPYRISRAAHGVTCSKYCANNLKSSYMSGELNHQYGLKGKLNDSYKGDVIIHQGYYYEYCPLHPYASENGRVRQHRLVVENNYQLFNPIYFEEKGGFIVLKKEYVVHHIDRNKLNNDVNNLQVLTLSEHITLHNKERRLK